MSFLLGSLYYFDSDLDSDLFKQNQTPQENQAQLILSLQRRLLSFTGESKCNETQREA